MTVIKKLVKSVFGDDILLTISFNVHDMVIYFSLESNVATILKVTGVKNILKTELFKVRNMPYKNRTSSC